MNKPVGAARRLRCAVSTRDAMLAAATRRFAAESYENVGLRDVAADVGVDVALVHRYFGGKEELFKAVLHVEEPAPFRHGSLEELPAMLAELLMDGSPEHAEKKVTRLLIMLRSASSPKASELVRNSCSCDLLTPIAESIGGEDAELRAGLMTSCLVGLSVVMKVMRIEPLASAPPAQVRERLTALFRDALRPG